ncbi:MAG TPA: flagellar hook capping FlgD N-terminal domain-containing protein [Bacillota bacterium]|nr:flagellar hook capping FlgD N-terminal domain-containing protein [Bacillota bacterium]
MNVNGIQSQAYTQENERVPKNQLGKNEFMQLLAAQIKYQDPLSGSDQTQNIAQMAQFSTLEQMQNLNDAFSILLYYQNAQYGSQLVGKQVKLDDGGVQVEGRVQRVRIFGGDVRIMVEDRLYSLYQVVEIGDGEVTD